MADGNYAEALQKEGRNLTRLAVDKQITLPAHREQAVASVLTAIKRKRSVLLVGDVGVGKTTILHGVAAELAKTQRELWELSASAVMSGTRYLGDYQTKLDHILQGLKKQRGLLYFTDVWNLLTVGTSANDPSSLFDHVRPKVQAGELQLIGEVTPERFQSMQAAPMLTSLFDVVLVPPLDESQIADVAEKYAAGRRIGIEPREIRELMALSKRFLPGDHGPGGLVRLIQQIADYQREKIALDEPEPIDQSFIEKVFSIYSGLPRFVVSRTMTMPAKQIREWFRERIIGQERAIEAVVEVITLFKAGLHDPNRPIGSLLFVGPTGVGKTELAKALARYLFGSETRLLRFDLSEFKDYHAFQLLVGDPEKPLQPARLLDPVRVQPFQVILFDEIEKAHQNVWDMLLQLLDEGHVSPPHGARANFRNTIVIATSNVGSHDAFKQPIGFASGSAAQMVPIKSLEAVFRPELLNRFQHIVTFDGLTRDSVRKIARREIQHLLAREGIISRNLAVEVGDDVLDALVETGFDREYGARALKRQVQQRVLFPIAGRLMESEVPPGSIIKLDIRGESEHSKVGVTRVRVLDSETSREHKREQASARASTLQKRSVAELKEGVEALAKRYSQLASSCGVAELARQLNELDAQRLAPHFWRNVDTANHALLRIDDIKEVLARLESLNARLEAMSQELKQPSTRQLELIGHSFAEAGEQLTLAERELVHMGTDGKSDILIAIVPIGSAANLRDLLFETYRSWAKECGYRLQLLADPLDDVEPIFASVEGPYAFGYLQHEHGVHRLRDGEDHRAVRVMVAPWTHASSEVAFGKQRALKQVGKFGAKIRAHVEVTSESGFVLQNDRTIAENRELAREIAGSWQKPRSSDIVVRRYDLEPFLLKDHLTGISSGKRSSLRPAEFHELLCKRVDVASEMQAR
jgi:ATP-dependent Clp protease ATP-binding subunit ClpC